MRKGEISPCIFPAHAPAIYRALGSQFRSSFIHFLRILLCLFAKILFGATAADNPRKKDVTSSPGFGFELAEPARDCARNTCLDTEIYGSDPSKPSISTALQEKIQARVDAGAAMFTKPCPRYIRTETMSPHSEKNSRRSASVVEGSRFPT